MRLLKSGAQRNNLILNQKIILLVCFLNQSVANFLRQFERFDKLVPQFDFSTITFLVGLLLVYVGNRIKNRRLPSRVKYRILDRGN